MRLPALRLPDWEARHWLTSFVLAAVFALNVVAGFGIIGLGAPMDRAAAKPADLPAELRAQTVPAPEPLQFKKVAPQDAVAINSAVPISTLPNPAARPFRFAGSEADRQRAAECLTYAIYYEAATESLDGQRAVAQVVLNRVRHPAYPNTVCGVVFQGSTRSTGCQFTFTCDGAMARAPIASIWQRARAIAEGALAGHVFAPVGWATHYHTNWVVPYWSSSLVKAATVGTHIFYRWTGGWGTGPAFRNRYVGAEPTIAKVKQSEATSTVDAAAAAAAQAAAAEALLTDVATAEQLKAGEKPVAATSVDSFQRAVLRRYEPAKAEGIAKVIATQTRNGEAVATSHRWALMGASGAAQKEAPLGKKGEPAKSEAAPAPLKELEGVRRVGDPAPAPAATK